MKLIFWEAAISGSENTENCLYCLSRARDAQQAPVRLKISYFIHRICIYLINKRKTWYQIFFQQYELRFWIGNFMFCTKHEKFQNPTIWSESPLIHILYLTLLLEIILERFFVIQAFWQLYVVEIWIGIFEFFFKCWMTSKQEVSDPEINHLLAQS